MYHRVRTYVPPSPSPSTSTSTSSATEATAADKQRWKEIQFSLREKKLIETDDFEWKVPSTAKQSIGGGGGKQQEVLLKYVGGVDVSYSKEDPSVACGTIVVLDLQTLKVVYQDYSIVTPQVPYVAGFLAFREVPILKDLLDKMKRERSPFFPQIVMVDGNGILHPRGFGSACHLGVLANVPTIGVGKNLHYVDGITDDEVDKLLESRGNISEDFFNLKGRSGRIWGAAMRPTKRTQRPIFISIGHRVSLETAIEVVKMTCKFRVPEPIRQADLISREHIQEHDSRLTSNTSFSGPNKGQRGGDGTSRFELNGIVDGMRRMKMNDENHQRSQYSSSSHRQGQNLWGIQTSWMGSVQSGRGSHSRPFHREIGVCFECGEKGHFKRDCPELQR